MLSYDEALERVLQAVEPLAVDDVPLERALGCALARDIAAPHDLPPFANSAMDGYAVRAHDTVGAGPNSPVRLRLVGEVPAGGTEDVPVAEGCAVRIMTGAPIPSGADAVVMVEDTRLEGECVLVYAEVESGRHIRSAGEDVAAGELVMGAGDELRPQHLGMLAAMGFASAPVIRRPRVALLTTGDEVVEPGAPLGRGQVRNSNRYSVGAQVRESGAELTFFRHVPDDLEQARLALSEAASDADMVVSVGGVSMGERDCVRAAMEEAGQVSFWRAAIKPGKPFLFGRVLGVPCFGLPGNPVSAMVTFELFVRPALRRMAGHKVLHRPRVTARLACRVEHEPGRREFLRARVEWTQDGLVCHPARGQGSAMLSGMLSANALAIVPEGATRLEAGDLVECLMLGL